MAKIVIAEYLTLDGVTEDPGPACDFEHRGWSVPYWSDELGDDQCTLLFESDALLRGRTTHEEFVASWPLRSGDPFTDRTVLASGSAYSKTAATRPSLGSATQGRPAPAWSS